MIHRRLGVYIQTVFGFLINAAALHTAPPPPYPHLFCILIYIFTTEFSGYRLSSLCHINSSLFCILPFWPSVCEARWVFSDSERFSELVWLFSGLCVRACMCASVSVRPGTVVRSGLPFRWMWRDLMWRHGVGHKWGRLIQQCLFLSPNTLWQRYTSTFEKCMQKNPRSSLWVSQYSCRSQQTLLD